MFDTMTLTKIATAVFGSWLVLLLGKWVGEEIYHAEIHGEASYVIAVESAEPEEPEEEVDFSVLLASASVDDGARVFRKCSACHKVEDGANGVGPHLYGVVDRPKAGIDGFNYSGTLAGMDGDWTVENLSGFLENPREYAPGTTMGFAGLNKPEDRADVIAYLDSLDD